MPTYRKPLKSRRTSPLRRKLRLESLEPRWLLAVDSAWFEVLAEGATLISLTGDYSGNGVVDAADYVVWRDTKNSPERLAADGDGNGQTNDAD